jgi:pectate lyase
VQGDNADIETIRAEEPFRVVPVKITSAKKAYSAVLKNAGAILPRLDSIDRSIIRETITGQCAYGDSYGANTGIIDTQNSVGGWPLLMTYDVQTDSDSDGMPDKWEQKHGLDPSDPGDRNTLAKSVYTMLEEYINGIK